MATIGYRVPPGPSIYEKLWDLMDAAYADYADTGSSDKYKQGVAGGVAESIALFTNPYAPNVRAVKTEAKRRYDFQT